MFYETLNKILWQGHPLANPVSGSPEEIKALSVADARDFYRRYYRPDNALLVLAGDIGAREARDLAQKYYGGIARPEGSVPQPEFEKGRAAEAETAMKLAGVEQPRYADYIRLDAGEFSKTDILSLQLLAEYLAGDDTAPLYDCLVYRGKTLLGIDTDVSYDDKLGGTFAFYATPAPEWLERAVLDGSGALRAVKEEIGRATEKALAGLTEEKLDKIKNRTLADTVYLQENPQTAAAFAGGMLTAGYSPDEIMNFDAAVQAATVSDIRAAWAKVQASRARATGWLEGKNAGKDTDFSGADAEAAERENAGKRGSL